jgi:hypothetical protein
MIVVFVDSLLGYPLLIIYDFRATKVHLPNQQGKEGLPNCGF